MENEALSNSIKILLHYRGRSTAREICDMIKDILETEISLWTVKCELDYLIANDEIEQTGSVRKTDLDIELYSLKMKEKT